MLSFEYVSMAQGICKVSPLNRRVSVFLNKRCKLP
jgi:hypothetical protein